MSLTHRVKSKFFEDVKVYKLKLEQKTQQWKDAKLKKDGISYEQRQYPIIKGYFYQSWDSSTIPLFEFTFRIPGKIKAKNDNAAFVFKAKVLYFYFYFFIFFLFFFLHTFIPHATNKSKQKHKKKKCNKNKQTHR